MVERTGAEVHVPTASILGEARDVERTPGIGRTPNSFRPAGGTRRVEHRAADHRVVDVDARLRRQNVVPILEANDCATDGDRRPESRREVGRPPFMPIFQVGRWPTTASF